LLSRLFDTVGSFCNINQRGKFSGMNKVRIKQQMEMWLDDLMITEGEVKVQE
jgi:hypothetical protein